MIEIATGPSDADYIMAILTLSRKSRLHVIRRCGGIVLLRVTAKTRDVERRKIEFRVSSVACCAIDILVSPDERKASTLMELVYIGNHPCGCRMTTRTILSERILVDVAVTRIAFGLSIRENQTSVARSTAYFSMLANKRKSRRIVVKLQGFWNRAP